MLAGLAEASHMSAVEKLPALVEEHAAHVGLYDVLIHLADLQQDVLRPLTGRGADEGTEREKSELRIDGTLAGRAFQEVRVLFRPPSGDEPGRWWVPLLDGTERLGVLRLSVRPETDAERAQEDMRHLASMTALLLVSKRAQSDSYARLVRTRPMNVAAEMQWNLLPSLTFANEEVVIGAALEPAYELGGDAFDYALSGECVHLAVFDAMGHDASAGLTANLAVAAGRNRRRQGADLVVVSEGIEEVLIKEFGLGNRFATAVLANLNMRTGMFTWVNRGHHPPVVIRGGRWVTTLRCPPAHPMGLGLGLPVLLCREQLEPGDRVLLYTDGMTEARNRTGEEFGLERFVDFIIRRGADGLPVPETLRRLVRSVLEYHDGRLQDDATVLLVEWRGGGQGELCL
ncbi:serine/threonine-protein phosphatase [Streptosporangium sp. NBC_01495]|uniref:PP2C family protein-serine/threonine phosphatase n=2 Tax=unclassified Streptosporangium TaxID=2632669 RepID=UPI002E345F3E|nr:PP2C family protein-serine/threonine phosphatase [Streptosporangium sp. NBC_01495]